MKALNFIVIFNLKFFMKKIFSLIIGHKIISLIILAVIITGGYFSWQKINKQENGVRYVTAVVKKGMLISSISGNGQVSASNQVDIKPKVSGDIVAVNALNGQKIKEGYLIAQIDSRDAARKVNEANASLETAKLELEELLAPVDSYTLIQTENDLADVKDALTKLKLDQKNDYQETLENKQKAEDNLEKAYEDAYNDIADTFLDLPDITTGVYTVLLSDEISDTEVGVSQNSNNSALINAVQGYDDRDDFENYVDSAEDDYREAKDDYDENFDDYKDTSRYSEKTVIEELLEQTLETTKKIADAVKSGTNMLDWWVEYRTDKDWPIYSKVTDYQSDLSLYTSQTNSHLSSLLTAQRLIEDYKEDILEAKRDLAEMDQNNPLDLVQAERNVKEKEEKLADLIAGADELEIKTKKLIIQQKENDLLEAQQNLADHFIRAPFEGIVSEVNVQKGESVSSNTIAASMVTQQKIAEITLNEIDAAQIKTDQKVTLEFDAIDELSISGEVVEIDTVGTVTQGVVSYDIKIAFDVQDERIKPGMSVNSTIIIDSKQDTLFVPSSAVKTQGNKSYVEILVNNQPQRQPVTIGISNDTMIEIISGIEEGDKVITQTITNGGE